MLFACTKYIFPRALTEVAGFVYNLLGPNHLETRLVRENRVITIEANRRAILVLVAFITTSIVPAFWRYAWEEKHLILHNLFL